MDFSGSSFAKLISECTNLKDKYKQKQDEIPSFVKIICCILCLTIIASVCVLYRYAYIENAYEILKNSNADISNIINKNEIMYSYYEWFKKIYSFFYVHPDVDTNVYPFHIENIKIHSYILNFMLITFLIGMLKKINSGAKSLLYILPFFISIFFMHKSHNEIYLMFKSDKIYSKMNDSQGFIGSYDISANFILECIISSEKEYDKLKIMISNSKIKNIFISTVFIKSLERIDNGGNSFVNDFFKFISRERSRGNYIYVFCDTEFEYRDIASRMPRMALSNSNSIDTIYQKTFKYAKTLKQNFLVDYVFGPVLDRKISAADQTISIRSYGKKTQTIKYAALAEILAFKHAGIHCIPKHFPGHPQNVHKNEDQHFKRYSTLYSHETLKINTIPFDYVFDNSFTRVNSFMTDHIIIPSISNKYPFGLVYDKSKMDMHKGGVYTAASFFSEKISDKAFFVNDDLSMLLSQKKIGRMRELITSNLKINIKNLTQEINLTLREHDFIYEKNQLDKELAVNHLAVLSRINLLSGHSVVLIRNLNQHAIEKLYETFNTIINDLDKNIFEKRAIDFFHLNENIDNAITVNSKDIKNNIILLSEKSSIEYIKAKDIIADKMFYFSSCDVYDDIHKVFNINGEINKIPIIKQTNIFQSSRINKNNINHLSENLASYLQNNSHEFYVFVLAHDWQKQPLEVIYNKLKKTNDLSKLIVLVAESPDYLFYLYDPRMSLPYDILHTSTVLCIYTNSHSSSEELKEAIYNVSTGHYDLLPLSNLKIDMPNYFHGESIDFKMSEQFKKIIFPNQESSIMEGFSSALKTFDVASMHLYVMFFILAILYFFRVLKKQSRL